MPDLPDPRAPRPARPLDDDVRDRAAQLLTRHFADDRLSDVELERRLDAVYAATTRDALDAVLADLPAAGPVPAATEVKAFLSGQERRITGTVPDGLTVRARLGYVELDLTHASFASGVTVIDVRAFMGYVQLRLPDGVRVECDGGAIAGYFALKGRGAESEDTDRVVHVTGRAVCGFAECYVSDRARLRAGP